jgi:hypothetical protein
MRELPGIKKDQVARVRPDDRAVSLQFRQAARGPVMRDDEFPSRFVVGEEEQTTQRVGIDMAPATARASCRQSGGSKS